MTSAEPTAAVGMPALPSTSFIDVAGVRTRHLMTGDGQPVVLLHGIGRSLEDWSENLQALAASHRVHAVDMIGFGHTGKPDVPYSLGGLARFVRHYLDTVGERRPVVLIGNSLGGAVALRFAADNPERTRGLVLVNSAGFGHEITASLRACAVPVLGELILQPSRPGAELMVRSVFHEPSLVTRRRVDAALDLARQPGAARAFLRVLRDISDRRGVKAGWRAELAGRLAALQLPTLIMWGEHDRVLPAAALEAARRLHPHARTHLFEGAGHMPQIERARAFNDLTLSFLKETQ